MTKIRKYNGVFNEMIVGKDLGTESLKAFGYNQALSDTKANLKRILK